MSGAPRRRWSVASGSRPGRDDVVPDAGMATAEFAVVLPVIVLVLAFSLTALMIVADQLRCVDAARVAARAAARGDTEAGVHQAGQLAAPAGSVITVKATGATGITGAVVVTVSAPPRSVAGWQLVPVTPSASATATREQLIP